MNTIKYRKKGNNDGQLYNEIYHNENCPLLYKNIMDSLSMLGGNKNDFSTASIE